MHIAMAQCHLCLYDIHNYSLKDLGEKKKQPFTPQLLTGLEFNMEVRQAETFAPPQKMSAMLASNCFTLEHVWYLQIPK